MRTASHHAIFVSAFRYSIPVLLGYTAIGIGFGLVLVNRGYPWWLSLVMGVLMYAGAGQYIAIGLFAAGAGLWETCLVQFVINARHMAYGVSMLNRFRNTGIFRYYLIYALTDETFALLSSLPDPELSESENTGSFPASGADRGRFMFYTALLDQGYWLAGSVIGATAGSFIPFNLEGVGFALTALFIVLMIEQILRVRRAACFSVSAVLAILAVLLLPERVSMLAAMISAIILSAVIEAGKGGDKHRKTPDNGGLNIDASR
ncbi:MAG: AzlC family ABC transporter permease [Treponema sp.]|jgi:4-azaleucine resistance transporter AzlC|nr:AzlC family ABC transporter permease [Treponema sp.]